MGLKGAANALMLRESVLALQRPIVVLTPLATQAESLASELAFFLDQSPDEDAARRKINSLPAWESRPFAHLSPPSDVQGAQLAALFALARTSTPTIVTSVEALMMRTIPRAAFEDSVIRIALAERLDLEALIDALASMGYQRVPQTEEPGDFSVRGGIIDVFSPLHHNPVRFELEEDIVTSIRHFDPANQRSLGEIEEATIIRTRYVPRGSLTGQTADRSRGRALRRDRDGAQGNWRTESRRWKTDCCSPASNCSRRYLYDAALQSVFDYLPDNALLWMIEPGRILAEAERMIERIEAEASAAQAKPVFYPAPHSLYLQHEEFERALAGMTAVEVGSLVTISAPREGWAQPIEVKSQASFKLGASRTDRARHAPSFEPLAKELNEVRRGQGRALDGGRRRASGGPPAAPSGGLRARSQYRMQELRRRCSNGRTFVR